MSVKTRKIDKLPSFGLKEFLVAITEVTVFMAFLRLQFVYYDFFWHVGNLSNIRFAVSVAAWIISGLVIAGRIQGRRKQVGDILILADVAAIAPMFIAANWLKYSSDNMKIYAVHGTVGLICITRCFYYLIAAYRSGFSWRWRTYLVTCAARDGCRAVPRLLGVLGLDFFSFPLYCGYIESFSPWLLVPAATTFILVEGLWYRKCDALAVCSVIVSTLMMAIGIL